MGRLTPKKETLRDLAIRSKNQCAYPGCDHPILDERGVYVAQLCHIEAALPGGPRYNPEQSDEERRSYENLLFLCYRHHRETDDVDEYPIERLKKMKTVHESGSKVKINIKNLADQVEAVAGQQAEIIEMLESGVANSPSTGSFEIVGPTLQAAWTPEEGRFYESKIDNVKYKFVMRDGWLHVEQTLADGAVQYFEVNKEGSVRNARTPYPINEYRVEIPDHLILSRERIHSKIGTHAFLTTLKWSVGTVIEHYRNDIFIGANVHTRVAIDHQKRLIKVVDIHDA